MIIYLLKILTTIVLSACLTTDLRAQAVASENQNLPVSIVKVSSEHDPVFKNLQLCYEAEFAPITTTIMTINGDYDQQQLAQYWKEKHDLYFFRVNEIPAGLAVVNYGSFVDLANENVRDIGEFYVTPYFRKKGYGKLFAHALLKLYPGKWEIRQLPALEMTARVFWHKVIATIPHTNFKEDKNCSQWHGSVQSFVIH